MGFDTSEVLGDALYRTFSRNGLLFIGAMFVANLVYSIGMNSLMADLLEEFRQWLIEQDPELEEELGEEVFAIPLAFDIEGWMALLLITLGFLATVLLIAVVLRSVYGGYDSELPTELVMDNLAWVGVNLLVGMIVFGILWMIGLALFIIPGIFIFVVFIYFMAAVAIEDRSFIDGMGHSWNITKGHRVQVFILFLAVWLIAFAVAIAFLIVGSFLALIDENLSVVLNTVGSSIMYVYFLAVLAISYRGLVEDDHQAGTEEDPFEEFTPASEGTQW